MEYLLQRFDFMTAGDVEQDAFNTELSHDSDKYEAVVNEDDLLAAFRVFRKGVCRPDFPGESTDQYNFACGVLRELLERSENLLEESKVTSLERIHDFCFDLLVDLILQGPGTGHIHLIKDMFRRAHSFSGYYSRLSGEKLKTYVKFLKREFHSQETDREKYRDSIGLIAGTLLEGGFSEAAYTEAQEDFAELYFYMELSFLGRTKEVQAIHECFASKIYYLYRSNGTVFKALGPNMFKTFIKRLEEIICKLNLTTSEGGHRLEKITSVLNYMLDPYTVNFKFPQIHEDLLDFVTNICERKAGSPLHSLIERVGRFYYHIKDRENDPILKGNSELFTVMTKKMIHFLTTLEDHSLMRVKFIDAAVYDVLVKCMSATPEHRRLMIDLMKACLRIQQPNAAEAAYHAMRECEKLLKWKEYPDDIRDMLDLITKVKLYGNQKEREKFGEQYKNFCEYLAQQITRDRVVPKIVDKMVEFCVKILQSREPWLFEAANEIADEIEFNGKKNKDLIMSIFPDLLPLYTDTTFPWNVDHFAYGRNVAVKLSDSGIEALQSAKLESKDYKVICNFVVTVMKGDFIDHDMNIPLSVHYLTYCGCGFKLINLLDDQEKMIHAILFIREVINLLTHEYKEVQEIVVGQVTVLAASASRVLSAFFQKILDVYIETENSSLLFPIGQIYPYNPRPLEPHFQTIFELIDGRDKNQALPILLTAAKKQPHLFTEGNIGALIEEMFQGDDRMQGQFLMILEPLSKSHPSKVLPHMKTLMEGRINTEIGSMYYVAQILKNVAIGSDQATAEEIMVYLEKHLRGPEDQNVTISCLNEMRAIGAVYRPLMEKHKPAIQDLRNRSSVQTTKDACTFILDVLEGRSLESLAEELKDVKEDVEVLEVRVTATEEGLVLVNQEVGKQNEGITKVKVDVKKQDQRIGELEHTVEDTKEKVEKVDSKSLSHAPFWVRDVSKLLNPEDLLDWRFLASRLGYSNDDVRGWAQMHDPCMAMLNEWYTTRKTSEATFAVLTQLQEMDRNDAAVIVENAMKMAESIVEEDSFEYPEPPDVFISYQWGIQNEVKLLKQHLEMAGFTCWMDIGQMGGGDKLFEKIDKGIRGAKVVLSCVTEKYAKSPNCNREVNLSVGLGKPMIPLLMEKLSWPPPGSMGPIFSEYLFIRFFTRPGERTRDQRYWSAVKFQELLMQLNYNDVKPDENKIDNLYKNWWIPVAEEIKIEKKNPIFAPAAMQQELKEDVSGVASPDVFISYQWDKQKQIQLLYKRLTELGFTCWMDIYQMGGGDSLYDKIDKGVRGAKIVLSCVTTKYSVSANCRREVSLADSLKKPIVPLLLEKMTWPPSGPMSMVFTQLLYITFAKDNSVQGRWEGDKFEELLLKLNEFIPDIVILPEEQEEEEINDKKRAEPSSQAEDSKDGSSSCQETEHVSDPTTTEGNQEEEETNDNKRAEPSSQAEDSKDGSSSCQETEHASDPTTTEGNIDAQPDSGDVSINMAPQQYPSEYHMQQQEEQQQHQLMHYQHQHEMGAYGNRYEQQHQQQRADRQPHHASYDTTGRQANTEQYNTQSQHVAQQQQSALQRQPTTEAGGKSAKSRSCVVL